MLDFRRVLKNREIQPEAAFCPTKNQGLEWMNSNPRMQIAVIIERQIKAHIKASPALRRDYTLLTSIKSVGPQLGMHMLVVLRSHNFASAEQAAAFLGVVPIEKRSGTSVRSRPRMSKIGPPQLRAKLYMSALCGKIYNKRMRNIYDEMCLRGKPKMVAIGALMRKLVHWCYGVLKTGTVFNDESLKQVLST
ncbi:Mobile element protein (plasmid) [Raoultella ornithinolytica]|nr:Mobile element protein [Raoultella ornithinolytica]